jgi:hypothetical protein
MESKMSELSAKDTFITSKSSIIQNLQDIMLGQASGTLSSNNNPTVLIHTWGETELH